MNWRRRYDDLDESGSHVVDEAGDEPLARQSGDLLERRYIGGNCRVGIEDRFRSKLSFLYLKIMRQHGRVAREASDAAIGVLQNDEVKRSASSWSLSGDLTDSPEKAQLFEQHRGDSTADVADHYRLARCYSKYVSRIDAHVCATDDECLYIRHRPWKRRHQRSGGGLLRGEFFVAFQDAVEGAHGGSP
jgi:hypothetical protein